MPIEVAPWFQRSMLRARTGDLFLFGDNMARTGLGGQAEECRGEPNAVGIPTKWRPSRDAGAYFVDADLPRVKASIDEGLLRAVAHLREGGTVVLPADGLGSGRAELARRAPRIHRYLERAIGRMREISDASEPGPPRNGG